MSAELSARTCIVPGCTHPALGLQCDQHMIGNPRSLPPEPCVLESDVASACDALLAALGWSVYKIGISEAGRLWQSAGIPDRVCFGRGRMIFVEHKRPQGGRQSDAQRAFQAECDHAGVPYLLVSSAEQLQQFLGGL